MCWQLRQQADRNSTAMALLIFVNLTRAREAEPSAVPDSARALGGAGDFVLME